MQHLCCTTRPRLIDLKQRGVGGDNSWGVLPYEQYRLLDDQYTYSYTIRFIENVVLTEK